jgi:hypothetical protein
VNSDRSRRGQKNVDVSSPQPNHPQGVSGDECRESGPSRLLSPRAARPVQCKPPIREQRS